MKIQTFLVSLAFFSLIACSTSNRASFPVKDIATSIQQVMAKQQKDWNAGNLDAFMEGYWKSDSLRFVSNFKVTYGWNETLQNYKRGYPNKAAMGLLQFEIMDVEVLSANAAVVLGRFTLEYPEGPITGLFTLTWKKIDGNWKITSDMTCG